jgi:hypothetical protein
MSDDPIDYKRFYQEAMREIMRKALSEVAKNGLPDNHFFHITFRTDHPGVAMSKLLRMQYPEEMSIVLQHVFYDLEVDESCFSVTLSFNRVQQRLTVPLESVTAFQDPPAKVGLVLVDLDEMDVSAGPQEAAESIAGEAAAGDEAEESNADAEAGGNVITFDSFRKN